MSTRAHRKTGEWFQGTEVPMSAIRRFARDIAQRYSPERIILFGSYAYGTPHAGSDVDILVVMPAKNELDQAAEISLAIDPPFPLDLLVCTPRTMEWRLAEGDWFLREITDKGKVLYEAPHRRVGAKGRHRLRSGEDHRGEKPRRS
jgi:predicted nucleotidyltransferase